jgi:hypothetical protein
MTGGPVLPPGAHLDQLERLGKIVNAVGVPLLLVLFLAINLGWVGSPLSTSTLENTKLNVQILDRLDEHDRRMREMESTRTREFKEATAIITRLTELMKMIDCSQIPDQKLRDRCLAR